MIKQEHRHAYALTLAWASWLAAGVLTWFRVAEILPVQMGTVIVLLIGVAIASGIALSRMRLAKTMSEAFQAGLDAAVASRREEETDYSK